MKLDRNINRGGRGKYALVNMRKLIPLFDQAELEAKQSPVLSNAGMTCAMVDYLVKIGIISLGNETPGDQFFVMKYKDIFAHEGIQAYADAVARAVRLKSESPGLSEFALEMQREADTARALGNRIPD